MTREVICGSCFDALEFKREDALPGALEHPGAQASACLVCALAYHHLPDGTPNVDMVLTSALLAKLAAQNRLLQNSLKDHLHEITR